jgi:aminomethyltransferase
MEANNAVKVWDAVTEKGKQFDIHAAGMLALDVARVEAGLLLIEVDYTSSKKALIESQKYSPYELGFAKMVHLEKENFIGKRCAGAGCEEWRARQLVGSEMDWPKWKQLYEKLRSYACRARVRLRAWPCRCIRERKQVGKATTTSVVTDPEEDDCAGQHRDRAFQAGNAIAVGDYDRGDSAQDECDQRRRK